MVNRTVRDLSLGALGAGIVLVAACAHGPVASLPPTATSPVSSFNRGHAMPVPVWGNVLSDPEGKPLGQIPVSLAPWTPCVVGRSHGIQTLACPTPLASTQTNGDGRFALSVPPGHYLLTIGSDSTTDLSRPTVHDNVWIKGAGKLVAPGPCATFYPVNSGGPPFPGHCLPRIPLVTPPPVERSGNYRLSAINHWDVPCIRSFDQNREQRKLQPAVVDEWITENNRANIEGVRNPKFKPSNVFGDVTEGDGFQYGGSMEPVDGQTACALYLMKANVFTPNGLDQLSYSASPQTHWFAATLEPFVPGKLKLVAIGNAQYPRDPRNFEDPQVTYWP
jgi:hypothetical protein